MDIPKPSEETLTQMNAIKAQFNTNDKEELKKAEKALVDFIENLRALSNGG